MTTAQIDFTKYTDKRVTLVVKPADGQGDNVTLEGKVELGVPQGLMFKRKGSGQPDLIEAERVVSIDEVPDKPKELKAKTLKPVDADKVKSHVLERHGVSLDYANEAISPSRNSSSRARLVEAITSASARVSPGRLDPLEQLEGVRDEDARRRTAAGWSAPRDPRKLARAGGRSTTSWEARSSRVSSPPRSRTQSLTAAATSPVVEEAGLLGALTRSSRPASLGEEDPLPLAQSGRPCGLIDRRSPRAWTRTIGPRISNSSACIGITSTPAAPPRAARGEVAERGRPEPTKACASPAVPVGAAGGGPDVEHAARRPRQTGRRPGPAAPGSGSEIPGPARPRRSRAGGSRPTCARA